MLISTCSTLGVFTAAPTRVQVLGTVQKKWDLRRPTPEDWPKTDRSSVQVPYLSWAPLHLCNTVIHTPPSPDLPLGRVIYTIHRLFIIDPNQSDNRSERARSRNGKSQVKQVLNENGYPNGANEIRIVRWTIYELGQPSVNSSCCVLDRLESSRDNSGAQFLLLPP